jgi:hypothetical protein
MKQAYDYINTLEVSKSSKTVYAASIKKCEQLGLDIFAPEDELISAFKSTNFERDHTQINILKICIPFRRFIELPSEELNEYRYEIIKEHKSKVSDSNWKFLSSDMPKLNQLIEFCEQLFDENKYVAAIVNFLLIFYNTRNLDLSLLITKSRDIVDDLDNYLFIEKDKVTYIRNNYKTSKTFNKKVSEITYPPFIKACEKLLGQKESVPLIRKRNGDRIDDRGIATYIMPMTYKKIGQANYFKIAVKEASRNEILRLEKNRGTSANTILNTYDVDKQF